MSKKIIPDTYPKTLEECLKILERVNYKSYGFPVVFLDYDYSVNKKWSVTFRNPAEFSNPDTKSKNPVEACHKMFDFLKTLNFINHIKVIILPDGKAREINDIGPKPNENDYPMCCGTAFDFDMLAWQEEEAKLRTFTVVSTIVDREEIIVEENKPRDLDIFLEKYPPGSVHMAEILNEEKLTIRIQ